MLPTMNMTPCESSAHYGVYGTLAQGQSYAKHRLFGKLFSICACMVVVLLYAMMPVSAFAEESSSNSTQSAAQSATDFDSWAAVAQSIVDELQAGEQSYNDGNHAKAASSFSRALNTGYVASNFAKVVTDTIGQSTYDAQIATLRSLSQLAYANNNEAPITQSVEQLTSDLTATAAQLDANPELASPRDYAQARAERTQQEREQLDAEKVHVNEGRGERTWAQVAEEMATVLENAAQKARDGDGEAGAAGVNDAYYQYYEKLGFEKNVMNAIGGSRVSKVESTFKEARKAMIAGTDADGYIQELITMLREDAAELDGGAGANANPVKALITSAAGQAFLVLIREGLEALLVVAAVVAYLLRTGMRRFVGWVYAGALIGLAASGVVAVLFTALFGGSGPQQEIMEGVCALVAAIMLVWSGNWMFSKRSVESWNNYIRNKTEAAVGSAREAMKTQTTSMRAVISLALLSFLAVFREGAETVIFYESIYSMTEDTRGMWIGGGIAACALAIIFVVIRMSSARIPIGPFFTVTSVLMSALAVIFVGGGVHALIEGDAISGTYLESFPTNDWLGVYPYTQTIVAQIIAAIIVISMFVAGFLLQRRQKTRANESQPNSSTISAAQASEEVC